MSRSACFGRAELVDRLARTEALLTFVTGDSGIGKSEVLRAAAAPRDGWINAPTRQLAISAGALQSAVLQSLADAVTDVVAERGALNEIADRTIGVAGRLLTTTSQELGKVVGAELLALVRGRLGADVGKALTEFVNDLRDEMSETLGARLYAAVDESMAETLAAFAREVAEFAEGRHVSVSMDAGERLPPDERRLLVGLAERLPATFHLRVAYATDLTTRREEVAEMRVLSQAVYEVEVPALDVTAVTEWLNVEDLGHIDPSLVHRATDGYPLQIGDLIRHLKDGGDITDAPFNEQALQRIDVAWRALPAEAAMLARALCVLPDPLPEPRLLELTGVSEAEFAHAVQQLEWARFFLGRVNGQPWFHEQRREFVLHQLSETERDSGATRAADAVWAELLERDDFLYVDLFAELANYSTAMRDQDPKLDAALTLPRQELAVAAALLELMLPQRQGASEAQSLLSHARRFTDVAIDPSAVFKNLREAGLIAFASNEHVAVAVPSWTAQAAAVIYARTWRTLKRAPIPNLTPLAYEIGLRPLVGEFEWMNFGVGRPSAALLSRMAAGADPEATLHRPRIDRRNLGVNLLARAHFAGIPIYAAARFKDEETRAAARGRLTDARSEIFGELLQVIEVLEHPLVSVPALRFVEAAKRAFTPRTPFSAESGEIRVKIAEALDYEQTLRLRIATAQIVRDLSSGIERRAMELEEPYGLYWDREGEAWIECSVQGAVEDAVRVPGLLARSYDRRFDAFTLEQALQLPEGAAIRQVSQGGGMQTDIDPVFVELSKRRTFARQFNSAQPRMRLILAPETLRPLIADGFLRMMRDARALQELPLGKPRLIPPTSLYVMTVLEEPTPHWVAGAGASVTAIERVSDSDQDEAHIEVVQGTTDLSGHFPLAVPSSDSLLEEQFGFAYERDIPGFLRGLHCGIDSLLSSYAGYSRDDIDFRWPGQDW